MGGMGSGLTGGRPTVESGHSIDINDLLRTGAIRRNCRLVTTITWRNNFTGEVTAEVIVQACLDEPDRSFLRMIHRHDGETVAAYRIRLTSTAQRLGGERLWFRCPSTGSRTATLHMPHGTNHFASRKAYGLGYRSQRSTPRDRACARMHKMRRALGAEPGDLRPISKPLRMRWTTFDAKMAALHQVEATALGFLAAKVTALQRRIKKTTL